MANEKRLIDANAFLNTLQDWYPIAVKNGDIGMIRTIEDVMEELSEQPTVDAVCPLEYDEIVNKLECLLCHATGGQYSKAGYSLEDMERMVTDYIEECCEEAVDDAVVHGQWVVGRKCNHVPYRIKKPEKWVTYACSECGYSNGRKQSNYCPSCGAKMEGDSHEID